VRPARWHGARRAGDDGVAGSGGAVARPSDGSSGNGEACLRKGHDGAASPVEQRQLWQWQEGDGARCSPRVKERAARLGSG
jgi:hypothetical protein